MAEAAAHSVHSDPRSEAPPPADFQLRPLQLAIKADTNRFKVACIHRRFGKTVLAIDWLKDEILNCQLTDPRGYFVFPFAKQGEEIAWDFLRVQCADQEDAVFDKWRLEVTFANGGKIKLLGAERYQKHRGKYADAVAFDECCDIAPAAWRLVFRPMLSDRLGKALFIGTPRGRDWFRDLWDNGGKLQDWASWHSTVYETDSIMPEEIEALRREMTEAEFSQEYLCDWDIARIGAFYQRQVNAMIAEDRVCDVPHDPAEVVRTAWYIDATDQLTVTYWQQAGPMLHCIDVSRDVGGSVPDMVGEVSGKPYIYEQHFCSPIDTTSERFKCARRLGVHLRPVPTVEDMDGISLVKTRLPRVRIDRERCEDLIEAGRQYHAIYDEKLRAFRQAPVRDWSSEYCGSMAVFMQGFNERRSDWTKPIEYPVRFRG